MKGFKIKKELEYNLGTLDEKDLEPDPIKQFERWFEDSINTDFPQPNAMTVATATPDGKPSARMMLLKDFDENGFEFFTNRESRKGGELKLNPVAAIVFWWPLLERQVRIEGFIEDVSDEEADAYFKSRPRGSRLGAWTSSQSQVVAERDILDNHFKELEKLYEGRDISRPTTWVGYILRPTSIEFWQGRPNRLHDRLRYCLDENRNWVIERLAP